MTLGPLWIDIEGLELTAEDRELLKHPAVGGIERDGEVGDLEKTATSH